MNRIKQLREEKQISMKEAAARIGIPYTTYVGYEKGEREPNSEMLISLASFFGVTVDYLIRRSDIRNPVSGIPDNIIPFPEMKTVPLIGDIACGTPILAEDNIVDYVKMPKEANGTFALRCKGDSMINARIFDGDLVFVRKQPDVENGEIAAVLIDNEATLKKVYKYPDKLVLCPCNPLYEDFVYRGEELKDIHILGKAVAFTSYVR